MPLLFTPSHSLGRLGSLDIMRGFVVAGMMLVNFSMVGAGAYEPRHRLHVHAHCLVSPGRDVFTWVASARLSRPQFLVVEGVRFELTEELLPRQFSRLVP
jgi:predicted acyltransferase